MKSQLVAIFRTQQPTHALDHLEKIENECGTSHWLLESRLALLQRSFGLERQKAYSKEICDSAGQTLTHPTIFFLSQRNEDVVSMPRFVDRVEDTLSDWALPEPVNSFFRFKLFGARGISDDQLCDVLRTSITGSIIDTYEVLLSVLQELAINRDITQEPYTASALNSANRLAITVADNRLPKIKQLFASAPNAPQWANRPAECVPNNSIRAILWDVRRTLESQDINIPDEPANTLVSILGRTPAFSDAVAQLLKYSLNFLFLPESIFLQAVSHAYSDRTLFSAELLRALWLSEEYTPEHQIMREGGGIPQSPSTCANVIEASISLPHPLGLRVGPCHTDPSYYMKLESLVAQNSVNEALHLIDSARNTADAFDLLELVKYRVRVLEKSNDWWPAVSLIVHERVRRPGWRYELPVHTLLHGRTWSTLKDFRMHIRLPIAIHLLLSEVNGASRADTEILLKQSIREFLDEADVHYCSDLPAVAGKHNPCELVYFLSKVCDERYLTGNIWIASSKELTEERIRICQALIDLDPAHTVDYVDEMKALQYRNQLQEGVDIFDRSRVFVNSDGLLSWAKQFLKEDFLRYQALIQSGSIDVAELQLAVSGLRGNSPIPKSLLAHPSESDRILVDLLRRLANEYLTNSSDGLDVFLSLRIRHGSLAGNLRGPLEEENLLTVFDEKLNAYKANESWLQRLQLIDDSTAATELNRYFSAFSKEFDSSTSYLLDNLIRIKSAAHPDGAFEIPLNNFVINLIKATLSPETQFDEFTEEVLGTFDVFLGPSMARVKQGLKEDFKTNTQAALNTLRAGLMTCLPESQYSVISNSIAKASTNLAFAIDRVADWFTSNILTDNSNIYTIAQLIEMGVKVTRDTHRGFNPQITTDIEDDIPPFTAATGAMVILDVMFTMLDNVFRHSGNPVSPVIEFSVRLRGNDFLMVVVRNDVETGIRTTKVDERLSKIRESISSGAYISSLTKEGGTGLEKLKSLGSFSKGGRSAELEFGFESDTSFSVMLGIPIFATNAGD